MNSFICPYCNDFKLKVLEKIVCPKCYVEMRSFPVTNIENRTSVNNGKDFCTGEDPLGSLIKFIVPVSACLFERKVYAIFPAAGMAKRSPLVILSDIDEISQTHPQLDSPFTRFFVKGMLYSGIGNVIPFAIFNPPIFIFWLSTSAFAGIYYYFSRKIVATGQAAREAIQAQLLVEETCP